MELKGLQSPKEEKMNEIAEWVRSYGLKVHVS